MAMQQVLVLYPYASKYARYTMHDHGESFLRHGHQYK